MDNLESVLPNWKRCIPEYELYPPSFKVAIPFLLASVVYHEEWVKKNLDMRHPFFQSRFMLESWQEKFNPLLLQPVQMRCELTKMTATGVSSMTNVLVQLNNNSTVSRDDKPLTESELNARLDARLEANNVNLMASMRSLLTSIPSSLKLCMSCQR